MSSGERKWGIDGRVIVASIPACGLESCGAWCGDDDGDGAGAAGDAGDGGRSDVGGGSKSAPFAVHCCSPRTSALPPRSRPRVVRTRTPIPVAGGCGGAAGGGPGGHAHAAGSRTRRSRPAGCRSWVSWMWWIR